MVKKLVQMLLCGLVISAHAEFRTWTAADGSGMITAEFQERTSTSVRLKTKDGKTLHIPMERLIREDRMYAELQTPPDLVVEINPHENNVSDSVMRRGEEEGYLLLDFEIEIRKKSRLSYSRPLNLSLFVIGEQEITGHYIILQRHSSSLTFGSRSNKRTIRADQLVLKQTAEASYDESDYVGYLLVIKDKRGESILVQSNKALFEKSAPRLYTFKTGSTFYPSILTEHE